MNKAAVLTVITALFVRGAFAATSTECPSAASAKAVFEIVDEQGRAVGGAKLLFAASNWNSTLIQSSDSSGRGRDTLCAGWRLLRRHGSKPFRYVRVMHRGSPVPGVPVKIIDSRGQPQNIETDEDGFARYPELTGSDEAEIEISLAGFAPQRASIGPDYKNGPQLFELSLLPVCKGISVY